MPADKYKFPQAGQRHQLVGLVKALGATTMQREERAYHTTFEQQFRNFEAQTAPVLDGHEDLSERIAEVMAKHVPEALSGPQWFRRVRWRAVGLVLEAHFRDGVIDADPTPDRVEGATIVTPDPSEAGHYHAQVAYRVLAIDALDGLTEAAGVSDARVSGELFDRAYDRLSAVTAPLLERLPGLREKVRGLESDADASGRRGVRWDGIGLHLRAMHKSRVIGAVEVPVEVSESNPFMRMPE